MPKFTFTSDSLPSELPVPIRAKMWAESMKAIGSSFEMGIVASRKFRGEVSVLPLGAMQVGVATTIADGPVKVLRTEEGFARDNDNRLMIVINGGETPMQVRQFDRHVALAPGEMSVVAMDIPTECATPRGGRSFVVMFPREMVERPGRLLERYAATRFSGEASAQRLLINQVKDLLSDDVTLDEGVEAAAADYIAQLVGRILTPVDQRPKAVAPSTRRSRLCDIKQEIARSYRNAHITPAEIGKALGLSGRSIQHLLRQHGTTLTKELTAARLEAAYARLKSAAKARVSEIAFQCGFADLSTFHRAFQARYGDTPNAFRMGPDKVPKHPAAKAAGTEREKNQTKKSARKSGRNSPNR